MSRFTRPARVVIRCQAKPILDADQLEQLEQPSALYELNGLVACELRGVRLLSAGGDEKPLVRVLAHRLPPLPVIAVQPCPVTRCAPLDESRRIHAPLPFSYGKSMQLP